MIPLINPPMDTEVAKTAPVVSTYTFPGPNLAPAETWTSGHRTPYGLAFAPDGRLWEVEHGPRGGDELNLIQPGKNYGWPTVEGPGTDPKLTNPLVTWAPRDASPSGAAIAGDSLVVACLRGERLYVLALDGSGGIDGAPRSILDGKFGRLRDVVNAPDGSLWVLTSNRDGRGEPVPEDDRIIRILPPGSGGVSVL
jgi:glucose/arabinose dehydrogenase